MCSQGLDHLGDALAGDVLERAGLEDDHHLLVHQRLVGGRVARIGGHQRLGAFHDGVGRGFGRLHDGAELLAGGRDARVLQVVDLERADFAAHRFDVAGDLAQLAVDFRVHRLEEALQRLRRDFGERDDVLEGDVLALLFQKFDETIEVARIRQGHRLFSCPLCPPDAGMPHPFLRCCSVGAEGIRRALARRGVRYSANTASILVLSVCALNGLTM